jgi:signal transduction histidine kinase
MRQLTYELGETGLNAEQQRTVERLRLTLERSLRLSQQLTTTSRLGDALFDMEALQAQAIAGSVYDELQPLARELGQTLQLKLPGRPLLAVAQPDLLTAVLTGLCDNALVHNPAGGRVTLAAYGRRNHVIFAVRDRGPAIEHKLLNALSERLGSAPQPIGSRPGSSGLGLWIAGQFARAMDSQLQVTRHRAGGLTFSLAVPLSTQLKLI